jgi:hypothetical protein
VTQDLKFANGTQNLKSPSLVNYNANIVVLAPNRSAVVPYATGGTSGRKRATDTACMAVC